MQFPVTIGLRRSRLLPTTIAVAAAVALIATWAWSPDWPVAMVTVLACVFVATLAIRMLRAGPAALVFLADGSLQVAEAPGEGFRAVRLLPGGLAHPWLTVVRYRDERGRTRHAVVTVDSVDGDDFRRLRVLLRWRPVFSAAGAAP